MENNNKRIKKKKLQQIYSCDRTTIDSWIKYHGLPIITINKKSRYIREKDLLEWENSMIRDNVELKG
jgi:hypothetical protein